MTRRRTDITEFWNFVDIRGEDDCWEWQRSRRIQGYGQFWFQGKLWGASRLAYHLTHGAIPEGKLICHTCDNPPCCNPNHLFAGTPRDNTLDMYRKGRANPPHGDRNFIHRNPQLAPRFYGADNPMNTHPECRPHGETHRSAKLSNAQVEQIRERRVAGEKQNHLARVFGVHESTISVIVNNLKRKNG